jgi:hypothetical protein
MEAIQRTRARKGALRGAAADEVSSLARLTEATRIALHRVRRLAERREPGSREHLQKSVAQLEAVADIWGAAWADVRFHLDRYLDPAVVEVLRSLRHAAMSDVDGVLSELQMLIHKGQSANDYQGRSLEAVNRALERLDEVSAGLTMAYDLIEKGGVGSSGIR